MNTNRKTKTNYQITNLVDQPLIVMHLPVNAMTFGTVVSTLQRAGTQILSDAAGWAGKHGAD